MNKAVFLDRDGTINAEKYYLYRIEDFQFLPGAVEGLKLLYDLGYLLIVITNQSGIARGYYTEDDMNRLHSWMITELKKRGVSISAIYYCPHLPNALVKKYEMVCNCRKPQLGMYEKAAKTYNIDISNSWAIGDKIRDCSICQNNGCKGFLIGNNEEHEIIDRVRMGLYKNVEYARDLLEAASKIVEETI